MEFLVFLLTCIEPYLFINYFSQKSNFSTKNPNWKGTGPYTKKGQLSHDSSSKDIFPNIAKSWWSSWKLLNLFYSLWHRPHKEWYTRAWFHSTHRSWHGFDPDWRRWPLTPGYWPAWFCRTLSAWGWILGKAGTNGRRSINLSVTIRSMNLYEW